MKGINEEEKKKLIPILLKAKEKQFSDETVLYIGGAIFSPKTRDVFSVMERIESLLKISKTEDEFISGIKPLMEFVLDED